MPPLGNGVGIRFFASESQLDSPAPLPLTGFTVEPGPYHGRLPMTVTTAFDPNLYGIIVYLVQTGEAFEREFDPDNKTLQLTGIVPGVPANVLWGEPNVALTQNLLVGEPELGRLWTSPVAGTYSHAADVSNRAMWSDDGINWTSAVTPANNDGYEAVAWSPPLGLFCAVARTGTGPRVMTSPDGIIWTPQTPGGTAGGWVDLCWGGPDPGMFVAVSGTGSRIMTSPDGVTWTIPAGIPNNVYTGICWAADLGLFIAVDNNVSGGRVVTSPDGITWTQQITPTNCNSGWTSVCWSPELHLAVAVSSATSDPAGRVMTSPNGITWTVSGDPYMNWTGFAWSHVCWSPELRRFGAVASGGTPFGGQIQNRWAWSDDGINWHFAHQLVGSANQWICWSPELGTFLTAQSNNAQSVRNSKDLDFDFFGPLNLPQSATVFSVCWSSELHRLVAVFTTNNGGPDKIWWKNIPTKAGEFWRFGITIDATVGSVNACFGNPGFNAAIVGVFTGSALASPPSNVDNEWVGFSQSVSATSACTISGIVGFKETAAMAPQGVWDVYAFPVNSDGVEGPGFTPVLNVRIV